MKYIKLFVICLWVYGSNVIAAPQWTGGNAWEGGIGVDAVYFDLEKKRIKVKGSDGGSYCYQWDINSPEITPNGNAILSVLMTALAAGKNVTLLYDSSVVLDGFTSFTKLILLK